MPLLHAQSIQSTTGAWSHRIAPRWAHATDPGDPGRPVDKRLGVLGRSGWYGSSSASAGPRRAHATAHGEPDNNSLCQSSPFWSTKQLCPRHEGAGPRIRWKLDRVVWAPLGPRHRLRPPDYRDGRSNSSAGARRVLVIGRCYPDTDAQLVGWCPYGPDHRLWLPGGPSPVD